MPRMKSLLMKKLVAASLLVSTSLSVHAQGNTEAFFKSTQLQVVIGYGPGGAYDIYGRTIAKHIGRFLPGKPSLSVQNMPGAGSMKAANYIATQAPKNGSQIATFSRGLIMQPLLDPQGVQYDPLKLEWIGCVASETSVIFTWAPRKISSFQDAYKRDVIVSASGSGADSAIFPYVINSVLGTKFKVITGYPDANATLMAVERGEADGSAGTSWSTLRSARPDWITGEKITLLAQMALQRNPTIDAPLILDFAKTDSDRRVFELIFSRQTLAYPFTAPQGTPADRLVAWRAAFDQTMQDPDFKAEAVKSGLQVDPVSADKMKEIITRAFTSPPEVIERTRKAIAEGSAEP